MEEPIEYVSDYKIISADNVVDLQKKVKAQLNKKDNEFEPHGGPFVMDGEVHQAMIAMDEE